MYFGRGVWKGPLYVFLGGPLPKEEGRTACAPRLAAARLAWMPVCCLDILVSEGREGGG